MTAVHALQVCLRDGCGHPARLHVLNGVAGWGGPDSPCRNPDCACGGFLGVRPVSEGWICHNCKSTGKGSEDELPQGWRWFGLSSTLEGQFDELECPLLCASCVIDVEVALVKRQK